MLRPLLLPLLLLLCGSMTFSRGADPKAAESETVTRLLPAYMNFFGQVETVPAPSIDVPGLDVPVPNAPPDPTVGSPVTRIRPLPDAADGEPRYDVREWFAARGVTGIAAVLLDRRSLLVVRGPKAAVERAEFLVGLDPERPGQQLEFTVRLWTYEMDAPAGPLPRARTIEEVRAQAGASLHLADSISLLTKSGYRARTENRAQVSATPAPPAPPPPPPKDAKDAPENPPISAEEAADRFRDGFRGSLLEAELYLPGTGDSVSMQVTYHARLAQAAGQPDLIVHVANISDANDGKESVIFSNSTPPAAAGGKLRCRVVTAAPRLLDAEGLTREERRQRAEKRRRVQDAESAALVRKALDGLPPETEKAK